MILEDIKTYAQDCISGKIISGQKHKWSCMRFLKDIDRIGQPDFPYIWNELQAENIVEWFRLLRHSKGVLAKQPIELTPWQKFRICQLYGWVHKDTGTRRFKKYFTEVARKNAKSQEEAGIALYEAAVTSTKNGEVYEIYTAGTKREQSKIVFGEAGLMLQGSPLRTKFKITRDSVTHIRTKSTIKPLSKDDGKSGDGSNPALLVLDEYHHGDLFMGGGKEAYCFTVKDWYQARGKFGSTPRVGALIIYGGEGHIGIVESVTGTGPRDFVSIEGNLSDTVKRSNGPSCSTVLGFCYVDYPSTTVSSGNTSAISGTSVNIPSSVAQTGITGNYTCYPQFYGRWNAGTTQRRISEIWGQKGKTGSPENIATIDGYYLIAVTQKFGQVGDIVCVVLANGTRINCMIADEKNPGDSNYTEWGHDLGGGKADVIEWESMVYGFPNVDKWRGQRVTTIINGGRYQGL